MAITGEPHACRKDTNTKAASKGSKSGKAGSGAGCSCGEGFPGWMLRKLAESFGATPWHLDSQANATGLAPSDAFSFLDIDPEQVTLLCATGFLKGVPGGGDGVVVPLPELIRFMEEHGDWWFALRGRKQMERLKALARRSRPTVKEA